MCVCVHVSFYALSDALHREKGDTGDTGCVVCDLFSVVCVCACVCERERNLCMKLYLVAVLVCCICLGALVII